MRGTVNKNITKPLHEILLRQVSPFSIRIHHDFSKVHFCKQKPTELCQQAGANVPLSRFSTISLDGVTTVSETGEQDKRYLSGSLERKFEPQSRYDKETLKQVHLQIEKDFYEKSKQNYENNQSVLFTDSDRIGRDNYNYNDVHISRQMPDSKHPSEVGKREFIRSIINGIPNSDQLKTYQFPLSSLNASAKFNEICKENENIPLQGEISNSVQSNMHSKCAINVASRCDNTVKKPPTNFEPLKGLITPENTLIKKEKNENFHLQKGYKQDAGSLNKITTDNVDKSNLQTIIRSNQQNRFSTEPLLSREEGKASESIGSNKKWNLNRITGSESKDVMNYRDNSFSSFGKISRQFDKRENKMVEDVQDKSTDIKLPDDHHQTSFIHFDATKKQSASLYERTHDASKIDPLNKDAKSGKVLDEKRSVQNTGKLSPFSTDNVGAPIIDNRHHEHSLEGNLGLDMKAAVVPMNKTKWIEAEKTHDTNKDLRNSIKENCNPCEFHPDKINSEKIAKMLKEHKLLLEVLLEKVNSKINDICTKKSKKRIDFSAMTTEAVSFPKKQWSLSSEPQEKLKRLSPPATQLQRKNEKELISPGKNPTEEQPVEEEKDVKTRDYIQTTGEQLRASVSLPIMTLQTSPSQITPAKPPTPPFSPLIDGTKLAHYHYSPLKQILSQCSQEKPKTEDKFQLWKQSQFNKKKVVESKAKETKVIYQPKDFSQRAMTYLKFKQKNEKRRDKLYKQDINISKIKKSALMFSKKKMNSKDSRESEMSSVKNVLQLNKLLAAKKMFKIRNNALKPGDKNKKVENADAIKLKEEKFDRLRLSKGIYFTPPKNEVYGRTSVNSKIKTVPKKVVSNTTEKKEQNKFRTSFSILAPSNISKSTEVGGMETSGKGWNAPYLSNHTVQGPMWKESTEYCFARSQWDLPLYKEKVRRLYKPIQKSASELEVNNPKKTIEYLTSLSRKFSSMPSVTTNPTLALKLPLIKSSIVPLSMFKSDKKGGSKSRSDAINTSHFKKFSESANIFRRKLSTYPLKSTNDRSLFSTSVNKSTKDDVLITADGSARQNSAKQRLSSEMSYPSSDPLKNQSESAQSDVKLDETNKETSELNANKPTKFDSFSVDDNSFIFWKSIFKTNPNASHAFPRHKVFKVDSLKYSWWKVKTSVKNMLKPQSECCVPDFDEMVVTISKKIENDDKSLRFDDDADENDKELKKEQRAKELALILKYSDNPEVNQSNVRDKSKVIMPKIVDEGIKNY